MWDCMTCCLVAICIIFGTRFVEPSSGNNVINIVVFYEESELLESLNAATGYIVSMIETGTASIGQITKIHAPSHSDDALKLLKKVCDVLDELNAADTRPDLALDFTRTGIPSESVKFLVKELRIPTFAAAFGEIREWKNLTDNAKKYLIQVAPPADTLVESVKGFALKQNMSTAVLLHDAEFELPVSKYYSLLKGVPARNLLRPLDKDNLAEQIGTMFEIGMANFFIAGNAESISSVLSEASMTPGNQYDKTILYSMSLDKSYPDCSRCITPMKVVHLTPELQYNPASQKRREFLASKPEIQITNLTQVFYFDWAVDAITAVRRIKAKGQWNEPTAIYCNSFNISEERDPVSIDLIDSFKEAQKENIISFNMSGTWPNFLEFNMKVEILQFKAESPKSTNQEVGHWKSGYGGQELLSLNMTIPHVTPTYRIVVVVQHPFIYKKPNCDETVTNTKCYYGYAIDLMNKIREDIPFHYTMYNVSSQGYIDEATGLFDGQVREIMDKNADFGLGAFALMTEREKVLDVTLPIYELTGFHVVMRVDRTKYDLFKFLSVLESDVWFCIVAAFFFTSMVMWFFERFSPYSYRNAPERYEMDDEKREFTFRECMWFCMTSLTPQGGGEAPKNLSGRLVAATWWLFGFIIIASYTANLAAFLTVSRLDKPIENLEDLMNQYRVHYSPIKDSPAWLYFDRMAYVEHRFYEAWKDISLNDSLSHYDRSQLAVWQYPVSDRYTKIWQAMQENRPPSNVSEAMHRLRGNASSTEAFALITETTDARYLVLMNCEFKLVGDQWALKPYVIPVQKGSPLKETFSRVIHKLQTNRWMEILYQKWWYKNPERPFCPRIDNIAEGISKEDIGGCFIVVAAGICLAYVWLIPEYIYYRWSRSKGIATEMTEFHPDGTPRIHPLIRARDSQFKTEFNKMPTMPNVQNSWG